MRLVLLFVTLMSTFAYAGDFNFSSKIEPSFRIPSATVVGLTNITYDGSPILTISPDDKFKLNSLKVAYESARRSGDIEKARTIGLEIDATNPVEKNFGILCRKMGFKQIVSGGGISINAMKLGLPGRFAMVQNGELVVTTVTQQNPVGAQLSVVTGLACTTK